MQRALFIISITLLLPFTAVVAQMNYTDRITIEKQSISKKSGITSVAFDVNLNDLKIDKNDMLVITPIVISSENGQSVELEPFAVKGRLRSKILDRPLQWKGKTHLDIPQELQIVRRNATSQSLHYEATTSFDEWQRQAQLVLRTEVIGCADCRESQPDKTVSNKILPDRFVPDWRMSYIAPEVEPVKERSGTYSAHLNYIVGRWDLLPHFENNAAVLAKTDEIITELKGNPDLTITDFTISGYASPEDTEERNLLLSQRRAETFAGYIEKEYSYQRGSFKVEWFGEDWDGLREAVAASQLANKEAILDIIDNESGLDARDARLVALDNGVTYSRLLNEFYPPLRRNDYSISFVSRPFDVEEAAEVIRTRPLLLSLNEMFLVAETYGENSPQYKEVFDIAADTFPESVTANINAAVGELRAHNPDGALSRLQKIDDNVGAWNLMGIAYAMKGDTTRAKGYFDRAVRNGHPDAAHNLDQLEQYINDNL